MEMQEQDVKQAEADLEDNQTLEHQEPEEQEQVTQEELVEEQYITVL